MLFESVSLVEMSVWSELSLLLSGEDGRSDQRGDASSLEVADTGDLLSAFKLLSTFLKRLNCGRLPVDISVGESFVDGRRLF